MIYTVFDIEFTSSYNSEKYVLVISSVIFIDLEIEYKEVVVYRNLEINFNFKMRQFFLNVKAKLNIRKCNEDLNMGL